MGWLQKLTSRETTPLTPAVYTPTDAAVSAAIPVPRSRPSPPASQPTVPSLASIVETLRLENPRHPLDEQVEVAGENFHVKGVRRVYKDRGMPITTRGTTLEGLQCILVPEPWNEHDPNAVAVLVGAHQVGYIPAELARDYSPYLRELAGVGKALATGVARIWAKDEGGGMIRARVTLLLPEVAAFI
jgi:hypothetical protein